MAESNPFEQIAGWPDGWRIDEIKHAVEFRENTRSRMTRLQVVVCRGSSRGSSRVSGQAYGGDTLTYMARDITSRLGKYLIAHWGERPDTPLPTVNEFAARLQSAIQTCLGWPLDLETSGEIYNAQFKRGPHPDSLSANPQEADSE